MSASSCSASRKAGSPKTALAAVALSVLMIGPAVATCFEEAGTLYNIAPDVLRAISEVESSGRWSIVHRNADGSEDVCGMQINSFWFPKLSRFGIERSHLLSEPCTCVKSAAWILANEIHATGYSWDAIGQYHTGRSGPKARKEAYADRVSDALSHVASVAPARVSQEAATMSVTLRGNAAKRRKFFYQIFP